LGKGLHRGREEPTLLVLSKINSIARDEPNEKRSHFLSHRKKGDLKLPYHIYHGKGGVDCPGSGGKALKQTGVNSARVEKTATFESKKQEKSYSLNARDPRAKLYHRNTRVFLWRYRKGREILLCTDKKGCFLWARLCKRDGETHEGQVRKNANRTKRKSSFYTKPLRRRSLQKEEENRVNGPEP